MKFRSCEGVYFKDPPKDIRGLPEGGFYWSLSPSGVRHLFYKPPYENAVMWHAPVTTDRSKADKRGKEGYFWWWNGDEQYPTLSPSLGLGKNYELWHGFLTGGRFIGCE